MNVQFGQLGYWDINFNDIPSGFVTLICCMHISGWDVITDGFVAVTSDYAKLYFSVWYFVSVLLLMNTVTSFFFREINAMHSSADSKKDEDETSNKKKFLIRADDKLFNKDRTTSSISLMHRMESLNTNDFTNHM